MKRAGTARAFVCGMNVSDDRAAWDHARAVLRTVLIVLGVGFVLWLTYRLQEVVLMILFAIFFAYLLAPIVEWLQKPRHVFGRERMLTRSGSIALVYGSFSAVAILSLWYFLPRLGVQLKELSANAPQYVELLRARFSFAKTAIFAEHLPGPLREMTLEGIARVNARTRAHGEAFIMDVLAAVRFAPWFILIPVIAFFLLKDARAFRQSALQLLPQGRVRWRGQDFFEEVNHSLASYVRAQLIACVIVGALSIIAYAMMGLPYALVLGVSAMFMEFIPFAGPLAAALLACLAATFGAQDLLAPTVIYLIALRLFQDYVVLPRLIGRGVNMHPLAIILAILCGSQLFGLVGLLLAIPMTAVFSVGYRHFMRNLGQEGLLAELLRPANEELANAPVMVPEANAPPPMRTGRLAGLRVVVVDNEPDALALLVMVLERAGATVASASSVAEAYSLISAARPHVLVSDIGMPQEDGFDLIRHVRNLEDRESRNLPAVALTGYAMPEDRQRAFLAGFQAHVAKPVDPQELISVVADLARQGARAPSFVTWAPVTPQAQS
jgi:predicted PurR-regulated permease PerM/CheY-like chemotaxis protein